MTWEAVIKVNRDDTPAKRGDDIAAGIEYACALLCDEYGWDSERVAELLERVTDNVFDCEARR